MTSYQRSPDHVGLQPTCKEGDLLVLNDDDVFHLLKAAVEREGSQAAFAKRYDVNRSELNSILNGRRRVSASLVKALGLRKVYVAEQGCVTQEREAKANAAPNGVDSPNHCQRADGSAAV
jgi:DNA-binding transcriptional regulator YdaS (Cro superfamily)